MTHYDNSHNINAEVDLMPTLMESIRIAGAQRWLPRTFNVLHMSADCCVKGA
jgi:hypothetical protein